jgi:secreted PhoX family phosphatase
MERRDFLRLGVAGAAAAGLAPALPVHPAFAGGDDGPYGPLLPPDANGIMLPEGFTSIELARADQPVGRSGYLWPRFPDGGATFATKKGWIYTSNSEVPNPGEGGVAAIRFDKQGEVVDAYAILTGTQTNCAGGPTPWGTWLSGEEHPVGQIWECDPTGKKEGVPLPALGVFRHEAAAVDAKREHVYLTEDDEVGRLYRFTPKRFPKLDTGTLEVAAVDEAGRVRWLEVPDPTGEAVPTNQQVPESTAFDGGEGIWYERGTVYFTTKGDVKVWAYDVRRQTLEAIHDPAVLPDSPLSAVDNIVLTPAGDVLVAEDQETEQELVLITPDGVVVPLLHMTGHDGSELAGPAFSPDGEFLYFSSQRGGGGPGITYAITGPFDETKKKRGKKKDAKALALPGAGLALTVAGAIWRLRERDEPA